MSTTNIFLNSYRQPENKLTYNFLCLLEHMPYGKEFCTFLTKNRISLSDAPVCGIDTVYSGGETNPDGAVELFDVNGQRWKVYIENKTFRRGLDAQQLANHVNVYCGNPHSFLLVITPRPSERYLAESISPKIIFQSWQEIAAKLDEINRSAEQPHFIVTQFIEYGKQSGEFTTMEMTKHELDAYVTVVASNPWVKLWNLFELGLGSFDFTQYGLAINQPMMNNRWGRQGGDLVCKHQNECVQWMFFGIYHNTNDHQLPFKHSNTPELAFIINLFPEKRELVKQVVDVNSSLVRLTAAGFEENLFTKLTPNPWQFLFRRIPLDELDQLTLDTVHNFIKSTVDTLYSEQELFKFLFLSGTNNESTEIAL